MKLFKSIKSTLALIVALVVSQIGFAQAVAPEIKRPVYEQLGISSTTLFTIMLCFTIFLILILIAVMQSTRNVYQFKQKKGLKAILLLIVAGSSTMGFSQETEAVAESFIAFPDSAFWAFLIFDIIIVMLILYFIGLMKGALSDYAPEKKPRTIFAKWNKTLTNAVDIEDEDSILLDHNYDGIQELDNDLPPWWKYGFYVTIVWGVIYFGVYHVFGLANLQTEEYLAEVAEGERAVAEYKAANPDLVTEETVELLTDASTLAKGKKIFETNCVACHAADGGGGIGPNLTDKYWLYDGDIKGVFHTVSEGANNGMQAWKDLLSPDKIQAVSSYVLSMPESANGKEPQGENIFE